MVVAKGDNGCMHAAGNLEVYAGRTLALLGRGLNKTFGLDMKTIGGQGIEVMCSCFQQFVRPCVAETSMAYCLLCVYLGVPVIHSLELIILLSR
eukprot:1709433-Amphidinium_carterae.1